MLCTYIDEIYMNIDDLRDINIENTVSIGLYNGINSNTKEKLIKTLTTFYKNNIEVIPHYNVKKGCNTKADFTPNEYWKETPYNFNENIKAVNDGVIGFMVRSGSKSNVSVIDYDFHGLETTNTTNILQRLKDTCTFYIITPSGGYHFYFKYDKRISHNRAKIFNNIDIKSEGGLLFLGIRDDGDYQIDNECAIIKQIPEDIIKELLEWKNPIKERIDKINNDVNHIKKDITTVRYNITDEDIYNYLYNLPTEYLDNTPEWKNITFILKEYGYKNIWDKWSKKSKYYDADKNKKIWNTMNIDNNKNDLNYIITILNNTTYKDNKIGHIKKIYKEYEILNNENLNKITSKIYTRYLDKSIYEDGKDIIVASQLNTGKSYSNIQNAKINKKLYFSIVALTSTQESQYEGFKNAGIPSFSYKNINKLNNDFKIIKDDYINDDSDNDDSGEEDDIQDAKEFNNKINNDNIDLNKYCIFTTIDSLLLFKDKNINFKNRIIYLDEIHSLLLYLLQCDNIGKKRIDIFSFLIKILRECNQIIALDGDICNNTITLMDLLQRPKYKFIVNTYKSYNGVKCFKKSKMDDMINMIINDIKNNEFNICCCNTKTLADKLEEILLNNGIPLSQILKYTSKSGKPIKNINEEWANKYIIYSPSIVAGLDFTPTIPINTYSFIDGVNTLNPEQIGQQICRNRNIKNIYVYTTNMTNILKYENMHVLKNHYKNQVLSLKVAPSFLSLMNRNYDVISNLPVYTDTFFNELYYELEYQNDILKSSYEYNLYNILKNKGFIIIDDTTEAKGLNKGLNKSITENIKDKDEDKYDNFLNRELDDDDKYKKDLDKRIEILGIDKNDTDKLIKYKDIINNQNSFNTHLKIRSLLYNDKILEKRARENIQTDYFINAIKSNINIIFNYKRLMRKYLPNIDLYKYEYDYNDEYLDQPLNIEIDDFNYIISVIRTSKNPNLPTHTRALVDLMTLYATHIFSKEIIKTKRINIKIKGKTISYYSREFNEDIFIKHINLFKIYLLKNTDYINNVCIIIKNRYYNDLYKVDDVEINEINKIISFYNEIAIIEKTKLDMINEPIIKANEAEILKIKLDKKEQTYIKSVAKMKAYIEGTTTKTEKKEKEAKLREYKMKFKKYKANIEAKIKKTEDDEREQKTDLGLKQKILLYLQIEAITNIEEVSQFKEVYNEIIQNNYVERRNILREYNNNF